MFNFIRNLSDLQLVFLVILLLDVGFLMGYLCKVFLLNRWLLKKGIKPKDFWEQ